MILRRETRYTDLGAFGQRALAILAVASSASSTPAAAVASVSAVASGRGRGAAAEPRRRPRIKTATSVGGSRISRSGCWRTRPRAATAPWGRLGSRPRSRPGSHDGGAEVPTQDTVSRSRWDATAKTEVGGWRPSTHLTVHARLRYEQLHGYFARSPSHVMGTFCW
jgi:hypothetical protein